MKNWKAFIGKAVRFRSEINELEVDIDSNMRGIVIAVNLDRDEVLKVTVDTSDFQLHNDRFMQPVYWDDSNPRRACWTAKQAGYWPENEKHVLYFMLNDDPRKYMQEIDMPAPTILLREAMFFDSKRKVNRLQVFAGGDWRDIPKVWATPEDEQRYRKAFTLEMNNSFEPKV